VPTIVEREYRKLLLRAFPDSSWKDTVIFAVSILEAVLVDVLTNDKTEIAQAMNSRKHLKTKAA
jgi:archaellum component FlaG (FlaF/FlaG flagellin family)